MFPLTFWDISLWLAVTATILMVTSELISPYYRQISLIIEKRRLRQIAFVLGVLFMFTVLIRVYGIVLIRSI